MKAGRGSIVALALLARCSSTMQRGELVATLSRDLAEVRAAPANEPFAKDEPAGRTSPGVARCPPPS
jgi:hypothetical protein